MLSAVTDGVTVSCTGSYVLFIINCARKSSFAAGLEDLAGDEVTESPPPLTYS